MGLFTEINSYFKRDPAARSRWEIVFCYPGFHALVGYKISRRLWAWGLKLPARWVSLFFRFLSGVEIHPAAKIGKRLFIDHGTGVVIGASAKIGDDVTIYHGVTLGGTNPIHHATNQDKGIRHPQIGNNVIIGSGAQLLGPITVGDNSRIGSNAVVIKDVEEGATMVGVPARKVVVKAHKKTAEEDQEFDAYGVAEDAQDPRQVAIDKLLKEVRSLKKRVGELEENDEGIEGTADSWGGK